MASGKKLFEILLTLTNSERQLIKKKLANQKELTQEEHFLYYMLRHFRSNRKGLQELERQYAFQERLSVARMRQIRSDATQLLLMMLVQFKVEDNVVIRNLLNLASAVELRRRKLYSRSIEINKKLLQDPVVTFYAPELRLMAFAEMQKISRVDTRYSPLSDGQLMNVQSFNEEVNHFLDYLKMMSHLSDLRKWERTHGLPVKTIDFPERIVELYETLESVDLDSLIEKPPFVFRVYALCGGILYRLCLHFNSAYQWLEKLKHIYDQLLVKSKENRKLLADQYLYDMLHLCGSSVGLGIKNNIELISKVEKDLKQFENVIPSARYVSYLSTLFLFKVTAMFKQGKIDEIIRLFNKPPAIYRQILSSSDQQLILHNAKLVYLMSLAIKGKTAFTLSQAQQMAKELKSRNQEVTLALLIVMAYASSKNGYGIFQYVDKMIFYIKRNFGELNILPILKKLMVSVGNRNYEDAKQNLKELESTLEKHPLEHNVFRQVPFIQIMRSIVDHEDLQQVLRNTDFHKGALSLEDRCRRYLHKELIISTF